MSFRALVLLLFLLSPDDAKPPEAGSPEEKPRPRLGFKVFNDLDQPVTGLWSLVAPEMPSLEIEIREKSPGRSDALVGVETGSGKEILQLRSKPEGIGFEGTLEGVLDRCDLKSVPVTEFLPLGSSIVLKFVTAPTSVPCPPIDSGAVGRFFAVPSGGQGAVRLKDFSEISSTTVRETYSIGGERQTEVTTAIPLGAVSVEAESELKFLRRIKAPLDGTYWFEVEAVLDEAAGVEPPRGFVPAIALRFEGSLTLKRAGPEEESGE
jgi:hypothetical protein